MIYDEYSFLSHIHFVTYAVGVVTPIEIQKVPSWSAVFRKYNVKRPTSYTHLGYREPTTPRRGGGQKLLCMVTIQDNHTSIGRSFQLTLKQYHTTIESGLPAVSCARGSKDPIIQGTMHTEDRRISSYCPWWSQFKLNTRRWPGSPTICSCSKPSTSTSEFSLSTG